MKKITLALLFLTTSLALKAQKVYDFTGSKNPGSWVPASSGISVTPSADGLVFEFGTNTPRVDITRAADPFDVNVGTHMIVTLINNNTEVGSFSGLFDKNSNGTSGTQFLGFQTGLTQASTAGAGVEKSYIFELSSANYNNDISSGSTNDTDGIDNMEYIGLRFRDALGNALTGESAVNGNIIIKKIEIVNAGNISKSDYDFANSNLAGFSGLSGGVIADGGTTLDFSGDGTKNAPKFAQTFYSVDASSNQYVHIVVESNASNADEIKFQFVDGTSSVKTYGAQPLNIGSSTIIDLDLSSKPEWTGAINEWRFVFSESANGDNIDTNPIKISKIVFDNSATLSSTSFDELTFTMFPNPAKNTVTISTKNQISEITFFNIIGKKVLEQQKIKSNTIDISSLKSGVYFVRIKDNSNQLTTKKLIIN